MKRRTMLDETIVIPHEARGLLLAQFPMPARLAHVLGYQNLQRFGELQGLSYFKISTFRNCGRKTIEDLRQLVGRVQAGAAPQVDALGELPHPNEAPILIPAYAVEFRPRDLPISPWLEHALDAKGVTRLGDLQGCPLRKILAIPHCGARTVRELAGLIERLAAGDFRPVADHFSTAHVAAVLRVLDEVIAALPGHERKILLLRLGNCSADIWTLEEIAQSLGLTRERVRQIEAAALGWVQRCAGLKINAQLRGVAKRCLEKACPLRPELLSHWLKAGRAETRYAPAVYVRLLAKLEPAIPIWPRGQEPGPGRLHGGQAEIARNMKAILSREGRPVLPLKEAWARVGGQMGESGPDLLEFLGALKRAPFLVVNFSTPDEATVRLHPLSGKPRGRPRRR